jgi:CRISPR/Cas system-associated exonuclease Cas4 (RecB family)
MNFFTPEARQFKPWSSSKLSTLKCGLKFEWQYNQKIRQYEIPPELETNINDDATKFGSGMHTALEFYAQGIELDEAIKQASVKEKLVTSQTEELMMYKNSIIIFERKLNTFKNAYSILDDDDYIEEELGANSQLEPSGYNDGGTLLRGKADRILFSPNGKVAILIDHKTGKSATLDYAEDQLDFYTTLIFANYPDVEIVRSGLYFPRLSEMLWAPIINRSDYPMDENNSTVQRINTAIASFYDTEEPSINITTLCKWCIYRRMCVIERRSRRKKVK